MDEDQQDYPDRDSPWRFYFNGVELPKWSATWCSASLLERARALMENWDERIGWSDLWILYCRIDHVGIVESEDPLRFCVCASVLLEVLLSEESSLISELVAFAQERNTTAEEVFSGLRDGLFQMLELATCDQIAFWTTGYEHDRVKLAETVRRHRLPVSHPDYLEAPHVKADRREAVLRLAFLRKDLRDLAFKRDFPKKISSFIHNLPAWS